MHRINSLFQKHCCNSLRDYSLNGLFESYFLFRFHFKSDCWFDSWNEFALPFELHSHSVLPLNILYSILFKLFRHGNHSILRLLFVSFLGSSHMSVFSNLALCSVDFAARLIRLSFHLSSYPHLSKGYIIANTIWWVIFSSADCCMPYRVPFHRSSTLFLLVVAKNSLFQTIPFFFVAKKLGCCSVTVSNRLIFFNIHDEQGLYFTLMTGLRTVFTAFISDRWVLLELSTLLSLESSSIG